MAREKLAGIYQIDSKVHPKRFYIGSSKDLVVRWKCHLWKLRRNKHHSKILQHHFNKYGEQDLSFSILLYCEKADLFRYEQALLDFYDPYLNVFKTAGSALGMKYGKETRERNRKAATGRIKTPEECKAISERMKGTHYRKGKPTSDESRKKMSESQIKRFKSPEAIRKLSESHKGIIPSAETLEKRSIALTGKKRSEETNQKHREVMTGKVASEETKEKQRNAKLGKPQTEEHKKNAANARIGLKRSDEAKKNMSIAAFKREERKQLI